MSITLTCAALRDFPNHLDLHLHQPSSAHHTAKVEQQQQMSVSGNPVFDLLDTLGLAEGLAEGLQQEGHDQVIVQVNILIEIFVGRRSSSMQDV